LERQGSEQQGAELSIKDNQLDLFGSESLPIEVNGVRAVNSVDLYDLKYLLIQHQGNSLN
jgi:hypothetical protein